MKNIYQIGDTKTFQKRIEKTDLAEFELENVHEVYSTFALGRDAEWTCRLFVLDMKEVHEEGIGTFLNIKHISPALLGQIVFFEAKIFIVTRNIIECTFTAKVGERLIAEGQQGQKIVAKEKLSRIFEELKTK